jgi:hypothetical protein
VDAKHVPLLPLAGYAEWQQRGVATVRKPGLEEEVSTEDGKGVTVASGASMDFGQTRGGAILAVDGKS